MLLGSQKRVLLAALVVVIGGVAAPAWASPNTTQYGNPSATTPTVVKPAVVKPQSSAKAIQPAAVRTTRRSSPTPLTTTRAKPGSLPFTGLDLAVSALLGVALVAAGLALRRGNRTVDSQ